jgi:SAM-dependent methyltransferase
LTSTRPAAAFDEYAATYDAALNRGLKVSGEVKEYFATGRVTWLAERLCRLQARPRTMLDFGCGTASTCSLYFDLLGIERLIGVDVSDGVLQVARRQSALGSATFLLREAYHPSAEVDLAFCNGVFHHIPPGDRRDAIDYVYQSLRPRGIFAFFENNPWNPATRLVMSRIPFDRDAITLAATESRSLLGGRGFELLHTDFVFFFPKLLSWARPAEPWLASVPLGAQYLVLGRKPG